jgi:hypothetical protein
MRKNRENFTKRKIEKGISGSKYFPFCPSQFLLLISTDCSTLSFAATGDGGEHRRQAETSSGSPLSLPSSRTAPSQVWYLLSHQ